jgi:alkanesulfonate monooxygenase
MAGIKIFSTCPQSRDFPPGDYARRVAEVARWSEAAGCEGILVYADNAILDAWLVSQLVVTATSRICPLVAVQPVYMHPYAAAKMVASFAHLHGRALYLNIVAGGFRKDLLALADEATHDERYDRVVEYGNVIMRLASGEALTFCGRYYKTSNLRLVPAIPPDLMPRLMVSGSSPAGLEAAQALGAIAVKYPKTTEDETEELRTGIDSGIRIGIVTRDSPDDAWRVALGRFPEDRHGQIAHRYAMQVSDSQWHGQLSELADAAAARDSPYWLGPFQNYKTFCPYLVGSYDRVAGELARYMRLGFATFILDVPASPEELEHIGTVFELAQASFLA